MNCIAAINDIIGKITKEMDTFRAMYLESAQDEDRILHRGQWRGLIDAYIIAVEVKAKYQKKEEE